MRETTVSERHVIYDYLLRECLTLRAEDLAYLERNGFTREDADARLIRSIPGELAEPVIADAIADAFGDEPLRGVAGFYIQKYTGERCRTHLAACYQEKLNIPLSGETMLMMRWALNLSRRQGRFVKPYYNAWGRIAGLRVTTGHLDPAPRLLTSEGFLCGSAPQELLPIERNLAH